MQLFMKKLHSNGEMKHKQSQFFNCSFKLMLLQAK